MRARWYLTAFAVILGLVVFGCIKEAPDPVGVTPDPVEVKDSEQAEVSGVRRLPGPRHTPNPLGPATAKGWTVLTAVPAVGAGVEGMSVASVGNEIIAALGFDGSDRATTRIYDIDTDAWSFGSNAPGVSSEGSGVAHGGLFYNVGGRGPGSNALWAYNPVTDTWDASLAQMPTGRQGLTATVYGNAIYAIGGRTGSGPNSGGKMAVVERYDIDHDVWTTVASLPSARSGMAAATVGGKIYVFGGFNAAGAALSTVDVYDPRRDQWTTGLAPMPTARGAMYAVAMRGGTVYVIGGWPGAGTGISTNEAYKVSRNQWTTGLAPMPTARAEAGAVGHGGRIYIVGGGRPGFGASVNANEVFKP